MNMLDKHAKLLKNNVKRYGRPVILTEPDKETAHELMAIWNDVEHGLKIDGLSDLPMGSKSSLYFDRYSLQTDDGEITPTAGWTATGSPSMYEEDKTYMLEIPKYDRQLPGLLFFLSEKPGTDTGWSKVGE